jgi:hypothetical protein
LHNLQNQFVEGLFSRGIPKNSLFFYCDCLKSTEKKSVKMKTIVKASDLLKLITKNSSTYGNRPAAVTYLHSMLDGNFKIFESITFLCWYALCNFIFNDTTYRMSPGSTLTSIVYHIDVLMSKSNLI